MTFNTKAVVLFGASGFVGRNLIDALRGRVETLIGVTRKTRSVPGCTRVILIDELDKLAPLPQETVVIHAAAFRYDASRLEMTQSDILLNNADLNARVFHFCAERGITELRLASSMAVYPAGLPLMDDAAPVDLNEPPNPHEIFYAWSKRWAEIMAELYRRQYGINCITFRLANPYGPYDSTTLAKAHVAPAFVMKALNDAPVFEIRGDPMVERDFTYVGDVVEGFLRSIDLRGCNKTYNLCTGKSTTLLKLAQICLQAACVEKPIESGLPGAFGPAKRLATSSRIKNALSIDFTSLEKGIKLTMEWYRHALKL